MSDTPLPVIGFALDLAEDDEITVAVLTLETGEVTFEFLISEDEARALANYLETFLEMAESRRGRTN